MTLKSIFDRYAATYDAERRRIIPCFDDFYGTLVRHIPFAPTNRFRAIDLGSGTGLAAGMVAAQFPNAELLLVDFAEQMLAQARKRFAGEPRVSYAASDYRAADLPGRADLAISAMSIHHLDDTEKKSLFARIRSILRPGGAFLLADLVKATSPANTARYDRWWQENALAGGTTPAEWAEVLARRKFDQLSPLAEQMAWLAQAGFADVDCWYKNHSFAVFGGFC